MAGVSEILTAEQAEVVNQPLDARLLVIAGPGTGKTHTLVERACSLAAATEMSAGASVLALSFTRAVVAEIQNRTYALDASPVLASTIHSYAWKLVAQTGETAPAGFDRTVVRAAQLVRDGDVALHDDHILVDEAQDLVGVVGDFVRALLDSTDGGFTIFGDPNQAIYDYKSKPGETDFFDYIREMGGLKELALTRNHRADPTLEMPPAPESPETIQAHFRDLHHLTSLDQLVPLLSRQSSSVALLTCLNGEGLRLASELQQLGVSNLSVRQSVTLSASPPWIAEFVNSGARTKWSRAEFLNCFETSDCVPSPSAAWLELRGLTRGIDSDNTVTSEGIRKGLQAGGRTDGGLATVGGPTISTIHRAKGLEWDDVVVLAPKKSLETDSDARQMYVAATRSRGETLVLERAADECRLDCVNGRWTTTAWSKKLLSIETRFGDVDSSTPPEGSGDAVATQRTLGHRVAPNDPVELRVEENETITVVADGETVGLMSEAFTAELKSRIDLSSVARLAGARVLCVRSTSGDPDECELLGLPATGVWLCAEIYGLAELERVS